jgi:hypothetical protein
MEFTKSLEGTDFNKVRGLISLVKEFLFIVIQNSFPLQIHFRFSLLS